MMFFILEQVVTVPVNVAPERKGKLYKTNIYFENK